MPAELWQLIGELGPRTLSLIDTVAVVWALTVTYRVQRALTVHISACDLATNRAASNDDNRDNRVVELALDFGRVDGKLDALHKRLDVIDRAVAIQTAEFTTEVRLRLLAVESKLTVATGMK